MRVFLLTTLCTIALLPMPADATTIVQKVSGSQRAGTTLNLFDPSLGTLNSVTVEGMVGFDEELVRAGNGAPLPAVDISHTAFGNLTLDNASFAATSLTGDEVYADGSIFGSILLSGSVFTILTGNGVDPFLGGLRTTNLIIPTVGPVPPQVGRVVFDPASPLATYSLTVTYDFTPVPEPAAWAMLLLGFSAIGLAIRRDTRLATRRKMSSQRRRRLPA